MRKFIDDFIVIFLGLFLVALEVTYILIPNKVVSGGVAGLAIVINRFLPGIQVGGLMLGINIVLFAVGFLLLGNEFGLKTLVCSLGLSGMVWFLQTFFPMAQPFSEDLLAQLLVAVAMASVGQSLVFYKNASTGGTDIIAKILNRFFHVNIGRAVLMADVLIVAGAIWIFGLEKGIYGFIGLLLNGLLIDHIYSSLNAFHEVVIISTHSEAINEYIHDSFGLSATVYEAYDAKSKENREVIRIILKKKGYMRLKAFTGSVDQGAYITSHPLNENHGFGLLS